MKDSDAVEYWAGEWGSSLLFSMRCIWSVSFASQTPQKVNSMSPEIIDQVTLFELQNRPFLEFVLLPSRGQSVGS
jgi:hypothetical protein